MLHPRRAENSGRVRTWDKFRFLLTDLLEKGCVRRLGSYKRRRARDKCPPISLLGKFATGFRALANQQNRGLHIVAAKGGVNEIAARYAKALFDLADEQKALDPVAEDLRTVEQLVSESDDLRRMVRSPVISRADQGKAMSAILDKAGASELTSKFIGYLAAHRRLFALGAITKAFLAELASRRGEVTAEVTSARSLSDAQISAVEEALKKVVGGKVAVEHRVDPSLIGGLIVKVGSRMVDSSLSTQLQKLKLAMKGA